MSIAQRRTNVPRKWSKIYTETVVAKREKDRAMKGGANTFNQVTAALFIAKALVRRVREKIRSRKFYSKRSIENYYEPTQPANWQQQWGTQLNCLLCDRPCLSECTMCKTCNSVAHRLCVIQKNRAIQREMDGYSPREEEYDIADVNNYYCQFCRDSMASDKKYFAKTFEKLRSEKVLDIYRKVIGKRIVTYIEQKRLMKKKRSILLLQSMIRTRLARKNFAAWRRCQMRVVIIKLSKLPPLPDFSMTIMTVIDATTHSQLFRINKVTTGLDERYLLPGITAHMTIAVTLCCRREDHQPLTAVAQAIFSIRDVVKFLDHKEYVIKFSSKIAWAPQESHEDDVHVIVPSSAHGRGTGGLAVMLDHANGSNSNNNNNSGTTTTSGSDAASVSSVVNNSSNNNNNTTSVLTKQVSSLVPSFTPALTNASVIGASSSRLFTSVEALQQQDRQWSCTLSYMPQNPIACMCQMVAAPPLDLLKKAAEIGQSKKNFFVQTRPTKWWLVLCNLRLNFFQFYGDAKPRFVSDVREATTIVSNEKGHINFLLLSHEDGRKWPLEFQNPLEAEKFEFALTESRKAHHDNGGSMYIKTFDMQDPIWK